MPGDDDMEPDPAEALQDAVDALVPPTPDELFGAPPGAEQMPGEGVSPNEALDLDLPTPDDLLPDDAPEQAVEQSADQSEQSADDG